MSTGAGDRFEGVARRGPPSGASYCARFAGDVSGAFADLGTFLPLVVGVLTVGRFDPASVLIGFGCFALAVAFIYRRPIPVQPMKAVAAMTMTAGFEPETVMAAGIVLGTILTLLALSNAVTAMARLIPQSVLCGVQLGVGAQLVWMGLTLMAHNSALAAAALAVILVLHATRFKVLSSIAILAVTGIASAIGMNRALPPLTIGFFVPSWQIPAWNDVKIAVEAIVFPQLALTIVNAVVITAAIASDLFPRQPVAITPRRLALSSGLLNLILAPLGAFPMCHGAGGLIVQYRFGARTGLAPALFGLACLSAGLLLGPNALQWLALVPLAAVGALLTLAGVGLAISKRLFDARPSCMLVIFFTAATCLAADVALGLAAGWCAEIVRSYLFRRLPHTARR